MAKKEALRDLQTRLAQRMQQAREEQRTAAWLAVECEGVGLLLPLEQAGEIFDARSVLPVPHTRDWFVGVANLRGGLHGVADLATFLGLRRRAAADAPRDGGHLVAMNAALGVNCALLVDRLAGLRQRDELVPEVEDGTIRPPFAPRRWRDAGGRTWQEIELSALAADGYFLAIAGQG